MRSLRYQLHRSRLNDLQKESKIRILSIYGTATFLYAGCTETCDTQRHLYCRELNSYHKSVKGVKGFLQNQKTRFIQQATSANVSSEGLQISKCEINKTKKHKLKMLARTAVIITPRRWHLGAENVQELCVMYIVSRHAFIGKYTDRDIMSIRF